MIPLPTALLRSIVRVGADNEEEIRSNLFHLQTEVALDGVEAHIVTFIASVADKTEVPTLDEVIGHYIRLEAQGEAVGPAGLAILEGVRLQGLPALAGSAFRIALDAFRADVLDATATRLLTDTAVILRTGLVQRVRTPTGYQPVTIKGVDPALEYLNRGLAEIQARLQRTSIEGDLATRAEHALAEYDRIAADPSLARGVFCGIDAIDARSNGLRKGELALVLGFVGHMKTTFVMNWAYHAAIYQRVNVGVISLEMPTAVLEKAFIVLHSTHPKFEQPVSFDRFIRGELTPSERNTLQEVVLDLKNGPYGKLIYMEPLQATTIESIRRWAERKHRQVPLGLLVVDYLGLVDPGPQLSGMESSSMLNRVLRQAKLLAMTFSGTGIPLLSPFQANRDGFERAEKAGGQYDLRALSLANEAERSSDLILSVYLDDTLRAAKELALGMLKNRLGDPSMGLIRVYASAPHRVIREAGTGDPLQDPLGDAL